MSIESSSVYRVMSASFVVSIARPLSRSVSRYSSSACAFPRFRSRTFRYQSFSYEMSSLDPHCPLLVTFHIPHDLRHPLIFFFAFTFFLNFRLVSLVSISVSVVEYPSSSCTVVNNLPGPGLVHTTSVSFSFFSLTVVPFSSFCRCRLPSSSVFSYFLFRYVDRRFTSFQ